MSPHGRTQLKESTRSRTGGCTLILPSTVWAAEPRATVSVQFTPTVSVQLTATVSVQFSATVSVQFSATVSVQFTATVSVQFTATDKFTSLSVLINHNVQIITKKNRENNRDAITNPTNSAVTVITKSLRSYAVYITRSRQHDKYMHRGSAWIYTTHARTHSNKTNQHDR